jgi:translation initiation factor IF-2
MCQSEPGGVPGLAQSVGVDVGRGICPGGSKYRPWRVIIRPGPGNPGLARPEQCIYGGPAGILHSGPAGIKQRRPGGESRPGRILLIRPSRGVGKQQAHWGKRDGGGPVGAGGPAGGAGGNGPAGGRNAGPAGLARGAGAHGRSWPGGPARALLWPTRARRKRPTPGWSGR